MCGIFCVFCPNATETWYCDDAVAIEAHYQSLRHRGPDASCVFRNDAVFMGFHRLSINDLSASGNQPMSLDGTYLICNGEIYNHQTLVEEHGFALRSKSDCEVILHLYNKATVDERRPLDEAMVEVCNGLDGEFAFVIYDSVRNTVVAGRDPYGVRPLFVGPSTDGKMAFASELKGIDGLVYKAEPFKPGHFMIVGPQREAAYTQYHIQPSEEDLEGIDSYEAAKVNVRQLLTEAVAKRVRNSDRRVCALLSGGLDSSLVAALAARHFEPGTFETFSIGMQGSPDLAFSKIVAEHIGSKHTIVQLEPADFLAAIPETVRICESYDTTTVRASVGNYLVSKYIRENTDNKVVLNGDYSDEVAGGYLYLRNCRDPPAFSEDCRRLVREIYMFDSLRSDRTISSQGLEARTPFSDKAFVDYYQSLPAAWRMSHERMEKSLLREAFAGDDDLLPHSILFRRKEAFSDAVSTPEESWHTIVKRHVDSVVSDADFARSHDEFPVNTPQLKETFYYRRLFRDHYMNDGVITHYWLPRFSGSMIDPSARELKVYQKA